MALLHRRPAPCRGPVGAHYPALDKLKTTIMGVQPLYAPMAGLCSSRSAVAGPVVAERFLVDVLVPRCLPFLEALAEREFSQAADGDVATSCCFGGRAVARYPAELHQAGTPWMPEPASLRYDGQVYLCHARIQTHYRRGWNLPACARAASTPPKRSAPGAAGCGNARSTA